MHKRWIGMLVVFMGLLAVGCTDPGCIRHSQCKSGYECRDSKCQLPESAAKGGGGGASGTTKAAGGTTSVARNGTGGIGASGTLGTMAGSSGASAAPTPDAGMSM